nr:unnamed protein product [Digitaria exilis]
MGIGEGTDCGVLSRSPDSHLLAWSSKHGNLLCACRDMRSCDLQRRREDPGISMPVSTDGAPTVGENVKDVVISVMNISKDSTSHGSLRRRHLGEGHQPRPLPRRASDSAGSSFGVDGEKEFHRRAAAQCDLQRRWKKRGYQPARSPAPEMSASTFI